MILVPVTGTPRCHPTVLCCEGNLDFAIQRSPSAGCHPKPVGKTVASRCRGLQEHQAERVFPPLATSCKSHL
eukprot:8602844-Pyramimonas_sp.AAC.1